MRILAVVLPIVVGLLLPAAAFHAAQQSHSYTVGQDDDTDVMASRAQAALPLVTITTLPGFVVLGAFLLVRRNRLDARILWLTSIVGTLCMSVIVLDAHMGMYDLLYVRGRMHSTAGIGFIFTSLYCVVVAGVVSTIAWLVQRALERKRLTGEGYGT